MKTVYLKIEGRVQHIGFRRWVISKAQDLENISGWVRNLEDGSVEVLMKGDENLLDAMIKYCYQGPLWARVDKISFEPQYALSLLPEIKDGAFVCL